MYLTKEDQESILVFEKVIIVKTKRQKQGGEMLITKDKNLCFVFMNYWPNMDGCNKLQLLSLWSQSKLFVYLYCTFFEYCNKKQYLYSMYVHF